MRLNQMNHILFCDENCYSSGRSVQYLIITLDGQIAQEFLQSSVGFAL